MTPAIVVLRTPDAGGGGSIAVRLPLWRPAFTPEQAAAHVEDDDLMRACLADAEAAHATENPAAAVVAARLLRRRPDLPCPTWLLDTIVATLEAAPRRKARGGRHADPWLQWRDDASDYLRYRAVELLASRNGGPIPGAVYTMAVKRLAAEGGDHAAKCTPPAIRQAYARVCQRCPAPEPYMRRYHPRYYPDIVTLHLLHAGDVLIEK